MKTGTTAVDLRRPRRGRRLRPRRWRRRRGRRRRPARSGSRSASRRRRRRARSTGGCSSWSRTTTATEPRFQISDSPSTQVIAGVDVNGMQAGEPVAVDATAVAYPIDSLAALPPGTYTVQALLQRYETFHRADGKTVKLPMDQGEGRQWNRAPGNLYSTPRKVVIERGQQRRDRDLARQGHPADSRSARDQVHQARADPERAADEVLGPPDVPGRAHPAAARVRRTPGRALPAGDRPWPLPVHLRQLPRGAARPGPEAGLLGALPLARLQPDAAGTGAPVLSRTGPGPRSRASC